MRQVEPRATDFARGTLHFDLSNRGDIGAYQLVFAVGDAAAGDEVSRRGALRRRSLLPTCQACNSIERLQPTLVIGVEILLAKLYGIGARCRRQLVQEAFVGEGILHSPWRPNPRGAQWCRFQAVADRPNVWKFVRNIRV